MPVALSMVMLSALGWIEGTTLSWDETGQRHNYSELPLESFWLSWHFKLVSGEKQKPQDTLQCCQCCVSPVPPKLRTYTNRQASGTAKTACSGEKQTRTRDFQQC